MTMKFQRTKKKQEKKYEPYYIILWIAWDQEELLGRLDLLCSQLLTGFEMISGSYVGVGMEQLNI
jgi:hypothetical protein